MINPSNTIKPLYVLEQDKIRGFIPKLVSLIVLGVIFYFGILLNISLLELNASQETIVKSSSLIILIIIIFIGLLFSYRKLKKKYLFLKNKIIFKEKEINYLNIDQIVKKVDLLDKMFKTYSIIINDNFIIKNISREIDLEDYLQKLIDYTKKLSA